MSHASAATPQSLGDRFVDEACSACTHEPTLADLRKKLVVKDGYLTLKDDKLKEALNAESRAITLAPSEMKKSIVMKDENGNPCLLYLSKADTDAAHEQEDVLAIAQCCEKDLDEKCSKAVASKCTPKSGREATMTPCGHSGNADTVGMSAHCVLTDEEPASSKLNGGRSVKMLHHCGNNEKRSKKREKQLCKLLRQAHHLCLEALGKLSLNGVSNQIKCWRDAKETLMASVRPNCPDHQLEPDLLGNNLPAAVVGKPVDAASPTHRDTLNACVDFGGQLDAHANGADNKNVAMVAFVQLRRGWLAPALLSQELLAPTLFNGRSLHHGSVHIGTFLQLMSRDVL